MRERYGYPAASAGVFRDNVRRRGKRRIVRERRACKDREKRLFFLFSRRDALYKIGRKRSSSVYLSRVLREGKIAGEHAYKVYQGKLRRSRREEIQDREVASALREYSAGTQ